MKHFSLLAVLVAGMPSIAGAAFTLDEFTAAGGGLSFTAPTDPTNYFSQSNAGNGPIGGGFFRNIGLRATSIATPGFDEVKHFVVTSPGFYDYASSSGADGATAISYERSPSAGAGPAVTSDDYLTLNFLFLDNANAGTTTITAEIAGAFSFNPFTVTANVTATGPQSVSIPLTGLTAANVNGGLGRLFVQIESPQGGDFRLDSIAFTSGTIVPEAGSVGLLAPAVALLGRRRR